MKIFGMTIVAMATLIGSFYYDGYSLATPLSNSIQVDELPAKEELSVPSNLCIITNELQQEEGHSFENYVEYCSRQKLHWLKISLNEGKISHNSIF